VRTEEPLCNSSKNDGDPSIRMETVVSADIVKQVRERRLPSEIETDGRLSVWWNFTTPRTSTSDASAASAPGRSFAPHSLPNSAGPVAPHGGYPLVGATPGARGSQRRLATAGGWRPAPASRR
jgi:hypothetical protein